MMTRIMEGMSNKNAERPIQKSVNSKRNAEVDDGEVLVSRTVRAEGLEQLLKGQKDSALHTVLTVIP